MSDWISPFQASSTFTLPLYYCMLNAAVVISTSHTLSFVLQGFSHDNTSNLSTDSFNSQQSFKRQLGTPHAGVHTKKSYMGSLGICLKTLKWRLQRLNWSLCLLPMLDPCIYDKRQHEESCRCSNVESKYHAGLALRKTHSHS